jgi:antitoxin VapB
MFSVRKVALTIRNKEAERLAAELSALTGESRTKAVAEALKDRLARLKKQQAKKEMADRLDEIAKHCASLPVLDDRNPEDMLYDEIGMPR